MIRRLPAALAALVFAAPAVASEHWTFCVASALGGKDVWITQVFVGSDRERAEAQFKELLERQGVARVVAQCPSPSDDKTGVVNAQTAAEDFNRKLGASLHAVSAQEFPLRR